MDNIELKVDKNGCSYWEVGREDLYSLGRVRLKIRDLEWGVKEKKFHFNFHHQAVSVLGVGVMNHF